MTLFRSSLPIERRIPCGTGQRNVAEFVDRGSPLLMFHGLSRCWQDLTPLITGLSVTWHVTASDHPGHGRSDRLSRYRVTDYIEAALPLLEHLPEPAVLVGHSLGALTCLGLAARVPEQVRAILLLDPPGPRFLQNLEGTSYGVMWPVMRRYAGCQDIAATAKELAEVMVPGPQPGVSVPLRQTRDAAAIRFLARCLHHLDPECMRLPVDGGWLEGFDPIAEAAKTRCPALLVVADPTVGGMLPTPEADALARAFPDGTPVDLPQVGHLLHWQDSVSTLRVVHAFLGSI